MDLHAGIVSVPYLEARPVLPHKAQGKIQAVKQVSPLHLRQKIIIGLVDSMEDCIRRDENREITLPDVVKRVTVGSGPPPLTDHEAMSSEQRPFSIGQVQPLVHLVNVGWGIAQERSPVSIWPKGLVHAEQTLSVEPLYSIKVVQVCVEIEPSG